ncbi:hypothetical protein NDU88_005214 [Pleurodeles waltl]|uniref:Uncharacterized protein n=1 Tax=Pleurodeles waltl TaxID=8319 RepID=A0AAV7W7F6_PLEWA|nr:hypothetical protein NDU88_005214 [Pleurodeles waltl]
MLRSSSELDRYRVLKERDGQTTSHVDQPVCDAQPVEDTMLAPMDEDTFQQLLDTFETSSMVLASEGNIVGSPDEPT